MSKNYYEILGVPETATLSEIKKIYKQKAKILHPDKGGDEEQFKKLSEAYQVLSDVNKRKEYDYKLKNPHQTNYGSSFHQNVNDFIRRQQQSRNQSQINVQLSLLEVLLGGPKTIKFNQHNICDKCNGTGKENVERCPICGGTGIISVRKQMGNTIFESVNTCHNCFGTGIIASGGNCQTCNGVGYHENIQEFQIDIPIGVPYGVSIKIPGRGNNNGDLNIVFIPDDTDKYGRFDDDIVGYIDLSYPELVLGCEKIVDTINSKVKVKINKLSKPNEKVRLSKLGLPNYHNQNRGDLYLSLRLKEITKLNDEEEKILTSLSQQENFK